MTPNPKSDQPFLVSIHSMGRPMDIECLWVAPEKSDGDLIVFLHEGLGSISMWRDWPAQVCAAANCRGLVFSRYGYGQSTARPLSEARPITYLHTQAQDALPKLFDALGMAHERPVLFGHSDGGSIALLYAATYPDRVKAIAVAAPHIFVEDVTIEGIRQAREVYLSTDLASKLGRHHKDVDSVFWSWNDVWLQPEFRAWNIESVIEKIQCPVLAIQGEGDEYGTLEQIRGIKRLAPHTELCIIPDCGHSPHRDQPQVVISALTSFLKRVDAANTRIDEA
jgi:pimeloyl-ACP methyl ester carboxylesterase